ncbi:hypothetical protein ACIBHY_11520 [Nonomuraea sp. NPDC050547]|uniref:hypothetical protein n=1 Tax=Nonomuraea sp. NPDC050547 TaxID=3364368 RepID=UPI0037987EB3
MEYTRLGSSGLKVSRVWPGMMSFGHSRAWQLGEDAAEPIVRRAAEVAALEAPYRPHAVSGHA